MFTLLALSIVLLLAVLAVWGAVAAVLGRPPDPRYLLGIALVELELVVQAIIALVRLAAGQSDPPLAPFLGYLLVSVVLLPFVARPGSEGDRSRWDSAILAAVCVAVAVAVLRLLSLW